MVIIVTLICIISFLWWAELAVEWWLAGRAGLDLADQTSPPGEVSLSVIVPARNEERGLQKALESLLAALPDGGEVLLVNDRSSDATGPIARRLERSNPGLKVIEIAKVPEGWLGKNHAMQVGYEASGGEWLLFTDADVMFKPGCLGKAVGLCRSRGIDHLVATPFMVTRGFWERVFVSFFSILLVSRYRIWRAALPRSRFYAGIGAFNLVNRKIYQASGTHKAIRSEVVDDLYLGRLIKRADGRQQVVSGERCIKVRWNEGIGGLIAGLEKNAYAGFDYRPFHALGGCMAVLMMTIVPAAWPFLYSAGPSQPAGAAGLAAGLGVWASFAALYTLGNRSTGTSRLYFITFPLGSALLLWAIIRSMALYYIRGGVMWRGTVYRISKPNVQGPK